MQMTDTTPTERHYHREDLIEEIIRHLKAQKIDLDHVTREDIAGVDEFHVRGAEVSKELAETIELRNSKILDVGCGIGGPCRMLADEYGCEVTGIDISKEFIRTATRLSELVGLSSKTSFIHGDATSLPFADQTFDVVWTQHVQMNIKDKLKFYAEIRRVLRTNGIFLYYDIFKKGLERISYPVPWANAPDLSFLARPDEITNMLYNLDFAEIELRDQTIEGIMFFEHFIARMEKSGPPKLGLNLLMGSSTKTKIINLLHGLKEGKIMLQSGVYKRIKSMAG